MFDSPVTVLSSRLTEPLDWPDTTVESGDPVGVITRLKAESDVPQRSHGSLTLNRALLNAGLIDIIEVTVFPVISGTTGVDRIFDGADDFDLELLEARTFDALAWWSSLVLLWVADLIFVGWCAVSVEQAQHHGDQQELQ